MRRIALKLEDFVLKFSALVYERALAGKILAALDILLHEQVRQTGDFAV